MSKRFLFVAVVFCALVLFACAPSGSPQSAASPAPTPAQAVQDPPAAHEQIDAAATPEELRALIEAYQANGDFDSVYLAAKKLIELDPSDPQAYETAIAALLGGISDGYTEIERLIRLCIQNAPDSATDFTHWANAQNQTFSFEVPFAADYRSEDEINTLGISPGNLSNQDLLPDFWRNGLLTTQGDWVYIMLPSEDYYVYKMRLDGTGLTPVGDARGDNLNVIGDWLYYKNLNDADMPYRIRTDGTQKEGPLFSRAERLAVTRDTYIYKDNALFRSNLDMSQTSTLLDGACELMSYYDGWIYYCTGGNQSEFCRVCADSGEMQKLLDGWMFHYTIEDGWIYYMIDTDGEAVQRMRPDGSEQSVVYRGDVAINSFGVTNGKLALAFCLEKDDRGKPYPTDFVVIDLATNKTLQALKAYVNTVYTAGDSAFYYDEDYMWHMVNLTTGETIDISPAPLQAGSTANAPEEQKPSVVGNTAANLFNGADQMGTGLFAAGDDTICFANPIDDGRLYLLRTGDDLSTRLLDRRVAYLNIVGDTIYFCDKDDNYAICSIQTDGTGLTKLSKGRFDELCFSNDALFFRSEDSIQKSPKEGGASEELVNGKMRCVYATGDWVYYIEDHEIGGLWRVGVNGGEPQSVLTDHPAKFFTILDDMIYCIIDGGDSVDVIRMNLDGSDQQEVFSLNEKIHAINVSNNRLIIVKNSDSGSNYMALILDPEKYTVEMKIDGLTQPAVWCFGEDVYYIADDGLVRQNPNTEERVVIAS